MALRFKYLHKVDGTNGNNNNKVYKLQENADGTFTATYGREGNAKMATETYPMSMWDKKLNEKLGPKKGYTDVTEHRTEALAPVAKPKLNNSQGATVISYDKHVAEFIETLQSYASAQTATVYKTEAKGVTQKQIDDAQKHINNLSAAFQNHYGKNEWSLSMFNNELTKLYIIIPRKMVKVIDHLVASNWDKKQIENLITEEQSNLDSMASQVVQNAAQLAADDTQDSQTIANQQTLLDILGLEMSLVTDAKELAMIKTRAENHSHRVLRVFKVVNKATQLEYNKQLAKCDNKKTELLWHGSRNQNWWFILQQGLKIRPSGAAYTGSMFGDGAYFALEADKSMGYTDNGRWVNGKASGKVYMALFNVHVGNQLIKTKHDSDCYNLSYKNVNDKGYDSVWAKKGVSLYRDELIVYNIKQLTIGYIVEFIA